MRRHLKTIILFTLAISTFTSAYAAGKMKPGLWEMHMKSDAMKDAPKRPPMSPEQIEQMKKMGINLPAMQDGAMVQKVCFTKEMVEQDHAAMAQKEHRQCKPQNIKQDGNNYSMELVCDGPELKGRGNLKGSYNGNDNVQSTYDFKGTSKGKAVSHHVETKGKWLSADCGNVKPLTEYKKKK